MEVFPPFRNSKLKRAFLRLQGVRRPCAACVWRVWSLAARRSRPPAVCPFCLNRNPASSMPEGGWQAACALEQARSRAYQQGHGRFADDHAGPLAERLLHLLHARGTLCNTARPCTVESGRTGMLRVCLPGGHKRLCESDGRVMRKACSVETGGCFSFDVAAIAGWVAQMRNHSSGPGKPLLREGLRRCAVVLSGHSLRCSNGSWARLIDSDHYDAVLRTNAYPTPKARPGCEVPTSLRAVGGGGGIAGLRTDFGYRQCQEASFARCAATQGSRQKRLPPICMASQQTARLAWFLRDVRMAHIGPTGLGLGHSGGALTDLAIAHCGRVDLFGGGLFSRGPGAIQCV